MTLTSTHYFQLPYFPNYSVVGVVLSAWVWIMEGNQSTGGPANVSEEERNQCMSLNPLSVNKH